MRWDEMSDKNSFTRQGCTKCHNLWSRYRLYVVGQHDVLCEVRKLVTFYFHCLLESNRNLVCSVVIITMRCHDHLLTNSCESDVKICPTSGQRNCETVNYVIVTQYVLTVIDSNRTISIWKMLGPFATASRLTPIHQGSLAVLSRAICAHRCPRHRQRRQRQRQRVTEGTAMAPWNGPKGPIIQFQVVE